MRNHAAGKRLIIPLYDSSEFFADTADYAVIDLNATTIEHIKALATAVNDLMVYKITEFSYDGEFMTADWDAVPDSGKVALKEFEGRMEYSTLNVTDSGCFWAGLYKHTDIRWITDTVPLTVLDEPAVYDERETENSHAVEERRCA